MKILVNTQEKFDIRRSNDIYRIKIKTVTPHKPWKVSGNLNIAAIFECVGSLLWWKDTVIAVSSPDMGWNMTQWWLEHTKILPPDIYNYRGLGYTYD